MKEEWVRPVLEDSFIHETIRTFGGYEDNLRYELGRRVFQSEKVLPTKEKSKRGADDKVRRVDMYIPVPQFRRHREFVELKMWNFVESVPDAITEDFRRLTQLPSTVLRTFLYFGFYGKYQNPRTAVAFDREKRLAEVQKHISLLSQQFRCISGARTPVDTRNISCTASSPDGYIFYAAWWSL